MSRFRSTKSVFIMVPIVIAGFLVFPAGSTQKAGSAALRNDIDRLCGQVEAKVIAWRRDIHEHPELGNREFRTARLVAEHLRNLGLEVRTEVAHTGVVGLLRGQKAGPVVALRADMDALPVKELTELPYASKVRTTYNGREVDVMHACGHDAHTAILMGVAEVLAGLRNRLSGSVKFIFQPSEDSRPEGEEGGAALMIKEGVLEAPRPEAIFGLHVLPLDHAAIAYRAGGIMAASNSFTISVAGRQTHGASPWLGIDPITVSAQIILGLQTIVSRQIDLTTAPAVITVGMIQAGVQTNIIPAEVVFSGTIRSLDPEMRKDILDRVRRTAESIARSAGAEARVDISDGLPVVVNNPALVRRLVPVLERVAGKDKAVETPPVTYSEDFAYYAEKVPGFFFFLGINPVNPDPSKIFPVHSPYFMVDESALLTGVRALTHMTVEVLMGSAGSRHE
jgi:amidohydrolase